MKKLAAVIALAAIPLAGCDFSDGTTNSGGAYVECHDCTSSSPGAPSVHVGDTDPFINFWEGAISDPGELNPPGSYPPGTSPLTVMLGGH